MTNEEKTRDEWSQWGEAFRSLEVDVSAISRKARRSAVELGAEIAGLCLLVPAVAAVVIYKMRVSDAPYVLVVGALGLTALGVSVAAFFFLRRRAFKAVQETPRDLLALTERQERARLRETRVGAVLIVALSALAGGGRFLIWLFDPNAGTEQLVNGLVRAGIAAAVIVPALVLMFFYAAKKRRSLETLAALAKTLE